MSTSYLNPYMLFRQISSSIQTLLTCTSGFEI